MKSSKSMRIRAISGSLIFLMIILSAAQAQDSSSPVKDLAAKLVAANTEQERQDLLDANKNLVSVDLRKAIIEEANHLQTQSEFERALRGYQLAKQIAEKIGDTEGIGYALLSIGIISSIQENNSKALEFYRQSLEIAEKVGNKALMARIFRNIGNAEYSLGNVEEGIANFQKSLSLAQEIGDKAQVASIWNNMGVVYMFQGNYRPALDNLTKALLVRESLGDKSTIASSLNNIAIVYDSQGNYSQALEYYQKSLKLREELGDKANIANVITNMGDERLLGSYDLALEYNQKGLAIAEEIGDQALKARALGNIGNQYFGKGDFDKALEYGLKSLALAEKLGDKEVFGNEEKHIANAYYSKGDFDKSLQYAERAAATAIEIDSRQTLWTALHAKGNAYAALHKPDEARKAFEEAIATIENWRSLVAGGESEEQSLFSEKLDVYHDMIELLLAQHQTDEAFQYAERAKGRMLLDILRSGKVNIYKAMTPQERDQEEHWGKQLASLNTQIQQAKSKTDSVLLAKLNEQLRTTRLDFESFRAQLYVVHPELRVQRGEAKTIQPEQAATLLSDKKSALLEYVVTNEKTFLFILTREKDSSPIRLATYTINIKEKDLSERIESFRKQIANRDARFRKPSAELYDLFILPGMKELDRKTNLIIVPDGALWELPFQALTSPQHRYLMEDYSFSFVPSLSVLQEMRKLKREESEATGFRLFAVGNPALSQETRDQVNLVYRDESLKPLPESETEVKELSKLYGLKESKVYVGSEAREDLVKAETEKFHVLHIATHAIINDATPMYSQVILARGTEGKEDGLLEAWEIMDLKLKADLVVLSACETALGKVRKGEGMIGLTWAFFVTGSSAEVVSQWKVASASTTNLMLRFHRNLKTNISKAEALRQAELKLSSNRLYRHPFYWAPFVLIGDGF